MERLYAIDAVLADESVADDQRAMLEGPNAVHREAAKKQSAVVQASQSRRTYQPGRQVTEPKRLSNAFER